MGSDVTHGGGTDKRTDGEEGRQTQRGMLHARIKLGRKSEWGFYDNHTLHPALHTCTHTHTHRHTRPAKAWRVKEMFVCDYCGVCAEK